MFVLAVISVTTVTAKNIDSQKMGLFEKSVTGVTLETVETNLFFGERTIEKKRRER